MLKYPDHDAERENLQAYTITHKTIQYNLDYVPFKYLAHYEQHFKITNKKKSQLR